MPFIELENTGDWTAFEGGFDESTSAMLSLDTRWRSGVVYI